MAIDKEDLTLCIDLIRKHYPPQFTSEMTDLIQLLYLEFKLEVTVEEVRPYCVELIDEQKDIELIMKTWQI